MEFGIYKLPFNWFLLTFTRAFVSTGYLAFFSGIPSALIIRRFLLCLLISICIILLDYHLFGRRVSADQILPNSVGPNCSNNWATEENPSSPEINYFAIIINEALVYIRVSFKAASRDCLQDFRRDKMRSRCRIIDFTLSLTFFAAFPSFCASERVKMKAKIRHSLINSLVLEILRTLEEKIVVSKRACQELFRDSSITSTAELE